MMTAALTEDPAEVFGLDVRVETHQVRSLTDVVAHSDFVHQVIAEHSPSAV